MDTTGYIPELAASDPLYQIADYTQALATALNPAWNNATLQNGWTTYSGGGGYETQYFKYRKAGAHLEITGMIKNTSVVANGTNAIIMSIPVGFRPKKSIITPCWGNAGACALVVSALTGDLAYYSGASNPTFVSVNIRIPLDN